MGQPQTLSGQAGRKQLSKWAGRGGWGHGLRPRGRDGSPPSHSLSKPRPSPCNNDEKVQPIPSVSQVTLLPKDAQGHHLHHHLHGEEGKDEVIEGLRKGREDAETEKWWAGGGTPHSPTTATMGSGRLVEEAGL